MMSSSLSEPLATIGKFIGPFGVTGAVKVYPYSDFPERCAELREVIVERNGQLEYHNVKEARVYKNLWIIHLEGCATWEDAARLTGSLLKIPANQRVQLPAGSYYFDEIIGLTALSVAGEKLGVVREVIKTGGNDIYVVESAGEKPRGEILVPATRIVVKEINLQEGYMLLDLPPGLVD
ncbi:MAG: ribosome maturation factor RimM [Bacillota bacterium]